MFRGSMVALVTPMTESLAVDDRALQALINYHVEQGTNAIVVMGTTGESLTLTDEERVAILKSAVAAAAGRIPIIAGTGTASTQETIQRTEEAMNLGVDGCLIVTPYYNRPTQEGLYQHYRAIAEKVAIPIILYNIPKRAGCDMLVETVARLAEIPNIVGIKEASGDPQRARDLLTLCGANLALYSGDDASALAFILQGGEGVISVTANVAPKAMSNMCAAALKRDFRTAGEINTQLMPLHKNLFVETNPIPVKWALQQMGLISGSLRLPLMPLAQQYHEVVREAMKTSGVL